MVRIHKSREERENFSYIVIANEQITGKRIVGSKASHLFSAGFARKWAILRRIAGKRKSKSKKSHYSKLILLKRRRKKQVYFWLFKRLMELLDVRGLLTVVVPVTWLKMKHCSAIWTRLSR